MCLMLLLPRESPVDLQGTIDWIGFGLGLVGLILFNLAWKYVDEIADSALHLANLSFPVKRQR